MKAAIQFLSIRIHFCLFAALKENITRGFSIGRSHPLLKKSRKTERTWNTKGDKQTETKMLAPIRRRRRRERLPCVWQENGTPVCFTTLWCGLGKGEKTKSHKLPTRGNKASGRKWCQMYHYWVCGRQTGRKKSLKGSISVRYCVIDFWCLT